MHFRHVLFYEYKKGNNVASAFNNICATNGEGFLSERTCRKWFTRFRERNFNLSDESRPGRPSDCNEEAIWGSLSKNSRQSTSEQAVASEILKSTVHYNLKKITMVNRYDIFIEKHLLTRVTTCVSLLARHKSLKKVTWSAASLCFVWLHCNVEIAAIFIWFDNRLQELYANASGALENSTDL